MNSGATKMGTNAAFLVAALWSLAGCSGNIDPDASTRYLIYNFDQETGDYRLEEAIIETLTDIRTADGAVVNIRGGGLLETATEMPQTEEEWRNVMRVVDDEQPAIEYTVDEDGTVIPWDFDSAMMLTIYHHYERASDYFASVSVSREEVGKIPVYYYVTQSLLGFRSPIPLFADNAAYAFTMNAFLVPPRQQLDEAVPLYANRGVITHEYAHAVVNRLLYRNDRTPAPLVEEELWPQIALAEIGSLDEGIADVFAALDTGDPNFFRHSFTPHFDVDRSLEVERHYNQDLYLWAQCPGDSSACQCPSDYQDPEGACHPFDTHALGAVIASAVWAVRPLINHDDQLLGEAVVAALRSLAIPDENFRLVDFFEALLAELPPGVQPAACQLFTARLDVVAEDLTCAS